VVSQLFVRRSQWKNAFRASMGYVLAAIGNAMFGVFPNVLPARVVERSLTASSAATDASGLALGFTWWIPGMLLATAYFVHTYRKLPATVTMEDHAED